MIQQIQSFIHNVLITVYQVAALSLICAFLLSCLLLFVGHKGWNVFLAQWWKVFRRNRNFRYRFFFFFSMFGILGITLLTRRIWYSPWENVIGNFQLIGSDGRLYEDSLDNILLFVPFGILLNASSFQKIKMYIFQSGKISYSRTLLCTGAVSCVFSLLIECCQSIFWLGTFQLADIFFNTVGGLIGGGSWCLWRTIGNRHFGEDS